jgi:hypothetical protein
MRTLLVSGALANKPFNGGAAWVRLSWVLGLRRLGFDAWLVECIDPSSCVDESGRTVPFEDSVNLSYFRDVANRFGIGDRAILVHGAGDRVHGASFSDLLELAEVAALLVNITGHMALPEVRRRVQRAAYIDLDPGFTQFWTEQGRAGARLEGHQHYFTVGANIGRPECPIPTGGLPWRAVRPPVLLEAWSPAPSEDPWRFTTVAHWRGPYGAIEHGGRVYGLKAHEFRKFLPLPTRADSPFELALNIHPADSADRTALERHGWRLVDPNRTAARPETYRAYVRESGAEFSVAQGVYVGTGSGWFSDRTANYLAAGKPALVQDTGFGRHYPVGEGLIPFRTLDEAARGADRIARDHPAHCRAAREIAEEYFDSDHVLAGFLEEVGVAP